MKTLHSTISGHEFFRDLEPEHLQMIVGCAKNVVFHKDEFIFKAGEHAAGFYLIMHGSISLEIFVPHRGAIVIETLEEGSVFGWSWLFPPYRWLFDARALSLSRAVAMDGKCLRKKKDEDYRLGYDLMTRFAQVMEDRLQATRLQLIDVYQNPGNDHGHLHFIHNRK